jgi:hypothetical protein
LRGFACEVGEERCPKLGLDVVVRGGARAPVRRLGILRQRVKRRRGRLGEDGWDEEDVGPT